MYAYVGESDDDDQTSHTAPWKSLVFRGCGGLVDHAHGRYSDGYPLFARVSGSGGVGGSGRCAGLLRGGVGRDAGVGGFVGFGVGLYGGLVLIGTNGWWVGIRCFRRSGGLLGRLSSEIFRPVLGWRGFPPRARVGGQDLDSPHFG